MSLDLEGALPKPDIVLPSHMERTLFEDLYASQYADVFRYALVLTRSPTDAEDVASETFARALRSWDAGHRPRGPALAWLLTIARNIATDWWRRTRRIASHAVIRSSEDGLAQAESFVWLESLARVLPARQLEVLILRYYRDFSDADIGRVMGLSESGVRSLVARAMTTLRKHPEVWQ
jgi:RNA polymerase sigma-70 factor (ECF subfamily)